MLFSIRKDLNYMHKLILIMNYFDSHSREFIRITARGRFTITYMHQYNAFHIVKHGFGMYYHVEEKEISFFRTTGHAMGNYSLKEDNTFDKYIVLSEKEIAIQQFVDELYKALEL